MPSTGAIDRARGDKVLRERDGMQGFGKGFSVAIGATFARVNFALLATAAIHPSVAQAQTEQPSGSSRISYAIPSASLSKALTPFGERSNLQVLYPADLPEGAIPAPLREASQGKRPSANCLPEPGSATVSPTPIRSRSSRRRARRPRMQMLRPDRSFSTRSPSIPVSNRHGGRPRAMSQSRVRRLRKPIRPCSKPRSPSPSSRATR
jgi:hypothetical protein